MAERKVIGCIPARYQSRRFPGKMLAPILGKSLIQRTYENTCRCQLLDEVVVATDDERIFDHVRSFGGKVLMSSPDAPNGTMRIAEMVQQGRLDGDIFAIVQGDEPCFHPDIVNQMVQTLLDQPEAFLVTPVARIKSREEFLRPSVVKCVFDRRGRALYFSRSPIPFSQMGVDRPAYRHLGLYTFLKESLLRYATFTTTPLQEAEDLEQLRILEEGYAIYVTCVNEVAVGVDRPEDIKQVEDHLLWQESTSSLQGALSPH